MLRNSASTELLKHVADNVRRLRLAAGLSQQALSEASGVSRRMLVGIESGDANVSLGTLDRVAEALGVTFTDLVKSPDAPSARVEALAWTGKESASRGVLLASAPASREVELWTWTLMPGDRYESAADPAGWHEMIVVIEGSLTLQREDATLEIDAGDFIVLASDQDYAYCNTGTKPLRFFRNVCH